MTRTARGAVSGSRRARPAGLPGGERGTTHACLPSGTREAGASGGVPRCRATRVDLSSQHDSSGKITICEGAAAMVVRKTAEQSASGRTSAGTAAGKPAAPTKRTARAREDAVVPTAADAPSAAGRERAGRERTGRAAPGTPSGRRTAGADGTRRNGAHRKGAEGAGVGRKSTGKKAGAARTAEQTGVTTVVAKKTPGTAATADTSAVPKARLAAAAEPGDLAVRPGEDPWTAEEVDEARAELQSETERLRTEITSSEESLAGLMRDSGDGAGDDDADTGTKNITREHEMALAANAREMLLQTERALDRLDAGTYGLCENCGDPIGKARMQAFPRATLCVECKQKQERRY
ncbi:TraR/DksA C4-type zinc finger protein [Streptomyces sp. NPDC004684]